MSTDIINNMSDLFNMIKNRHFIVYKHHYVDIGKYYLIDLEDKLTIIIHPSDVSELFELVRNYKISELLD